MEFAHGNCSSGRLKTSNRKSLTTSLRFAKSCTISSQGYCGRNTSACQRLKRETWSCGIIVAVFTALSTILWRNMDLGRCIRQTSEPAGAQLAQFKYLLWDKSGQLAMLLRDKFDQTQLSHEIRVVLLRRHMTDHVGIAVPSSLPDQTLSWNNISRYRCHFSQNQHFRWMSTMQLNKMRTGCRPIQEIPEHLPPAWHGRPPIYQKLICSRERYDRYYRASKL